MYCPTNKKNKYHETEKPVELIEKIIDIFSINNKHTILDFTAGSCSTGVASLNKGKKFIGIELSKKYFDISKERMSNNNVM